MTPPLKAATEEMNRTRPKPRSRIPGNVRRASRKGARIDRQRMVEDRGIDVLETGLAREAVIGDEDVHRSERRLDIVDQLFWSIGICHVRAERTRRPKCSRNGPRLSGALFAEILVLGERTDHIDDHSEVSRSGGPHDDDR
jgi:hypothetical protein